jgi:hypothetical protein
MDLFIRVVEMIWSTGGIMAGTTGRQMPPYIAKCEGLTSKRDADQLGKFDPSIASCGFRSLPI